MTEINIQTERFVFVANYSTSAPAELSNITRGDTITLDLQFDVKSELTVASGETVTIQSGTTQFHDTVTVDGTLVVDGTLISYTPITDNGTLENNGTISVINDGLTKLLEQYDRVAGDFAAIETLTNGQKFREQLPDNGAVNSLVVGIEPADELQSRSIPGLWGLIVDITDNRNRPLINPQVQLEVRILDEYSQFNSVTDVQNSLRV